MSRAGEAPQAAIRTDDEGRTWIAGIGEPLPAGERVLWAGSPVRNAVARRICKVRGLTWYFVGLAAFVYWIQLGNLGARTAAVNTAVVVLMALAVLGFTFVFAALVARSTVYAVTDRRVVLRIGVGVPAVLNIPLTKIESVDVRRDGGGTGDVVLTLGGTDRIAYLLLWPHARPWRYAQPQPALRCVPDAVGVGQALAEALQADAARAVEAGAQDAPAAGVPAPAGDLRHAPALAPRAMAEVA